MGEQPFSVAAADLDGDGKPNLVLGNMVLGIGNGDRVSMLLNKGDGTFAPAGRLNTVWSIKKVSAVDVNGDGKPNVVVLTDQSVSVYLNQGRGAFAHKVDYPVGTWAESSYATSFVAADLDGDGKPDLAVTSANTAFHFGQSNVNVLLNKGDGTFAVRGAYPIGDDSQSIAAADLDGDGKLDLALTDTAPNSAEGEGCVVSVLLNKGGGTFAPRVDYPVGRRSDFGHGGGPRRRR